MSNALPKHMQAISITEPGTPDVLQLVTLPLPEPKPEEVLIKVAAAGVNRPDVLQRMGRYPVPPGASPLLGLEVAGTVAAVGDVSSGWKIGDTVCALTPGGGYAEYCVAPASNCLPVPHGLTATQAASLPETFFTVWSNVFDRGRLRPGETFLVQGGASGIGVTAIQMVHALGHRVFATAGSDDKCRTCESLGAERCVNYKTADFVEVVKSLTDGRGVDVILDIVGASYFDRNIAALAMDGRLVIIAFLGGAKVKEVGLHSIVAKRAVVTGSLLRPRTGDEKAAIAGALHANVWPILAAGRCWPVIDSVFPLARAADAHRRMESGDHIGKIVLEVGA